MSKSLERIFEEQFKRIDTLGDKVVELSRENLKLKEVLKMYKNSTEDIAKVLLNDSHADEDLKKAIRLSVNILNDELKELLDD
jgi:hypothetical protein